MKHLRCADEVSFEASALGIEGASRMHLKLLSDDSVCIELAPGGHPRITGMVTRNGFL